MPKTIDLRKEIRSKSPGELTTTLEELRAELATLTVKARQGSVEQPSRIRQIRQQIARILTVMNEPKATT